MTEATAAARPARRASSALAGERPHLLFLSQMLPYPPDGGAHLRTYNVLRLLSRAFDVTALCFYRAIERPTRDSVAESVAALGRFARVEAFPIPQEHDRPRLLWDHARALLRRRPHVLYTYRSGAFAERLARILDERRVDLVHADSLDMAVHLPSVGDRPIACVHHNVESELLRRRARIEHGWRRAYVEDQATLMERLEAEWCERVALNVTVSTRDRDALSALAPRGRFAVVENGVDTDYFRPGAGDGRGIVCVGGLNAFANRDGLDFLCDAILPALGGASAVGPVRWVGRADQALRERYAAHGVELAGYVDDARPIVGDARCYVVPLRVGGGTRVKIVDAWAMGMPVVSTSVGCEGLQARDGENILVRDGPAEFAAAVRSVLADDALRARLAEGGRRTAERCYDWEVVGTRMLESYRALTGAATREGR